MSAANSYVRPEDAKMYRKDLKALRRVLDYIGDD
jgi:hypothetical protein